jgi:hypothetical protein
MTSRWTDGGKGADRGGAVFGILLIAAGLLFLLGEQVNIDWSNYGWPLFIIVPGVILLLIGLAIPSEAGLGAAIPGGIITSVGLILGFQQATDTYASWAYMWALVAPGSVGVTLFLYGVLHRRFDLVDAGLRTAAVGLGLFVGFGLFFENVVAIDESSRTTYLKDAMPALAVLLGFIIVLLNLLPRGHRDEPPMADTWNPDDTRTSPPSS